MRFADAARDGPAAGESAHGTVFLPESPCSGRQRCRNKGLWCGESRVTLVDMAAFHIIQHSIKGIALCAISLWCLPAWAATGDCIESNAAEADFPNSLVVSVNGDSEGLIAAWYDGATSRYKHGVLGDDIEAGELHAITNHDGEQCVQRLVLDEDEVFEDLAPRLVDMDGDGEMDIVAVVSHARLGAKLAVFGHAENRDGLVLKASTPNIGTSYRWLAPIGTGDFNADGRMDVAFVDRPHLAQVLRVFSYEPGGGLTQVASANGFTNHRIGEDFISSGVRSCDGESTLITVDPAWQTIQATSLKESTLLTVEFGAFEGISSIEAALDCDS